MSIESHPIVWTPEKVERIWNYYGSNSAYDNAYFARHSGNRILAEVDKLIGITGTILDIGCGPGHLLEHAKTFPSWTSYTGIDTSEDSLEKLLSKASVDKRRIEGLHVKDAGRIQERSIDRAFCVEVMEHCDDETLKKIFMLIRRVIKDDGYVVITTPNTEDLEKSTQICPECGCVYHKWQHVRSWAYTDMCEFIKSCDFDIYSVFTCHFGRDDLGRAIIERLSAFFRHGKNWRNSFLHLPQILLLATPHKLEQRN